MFSQWSESKANTNVSHFKQFYQQVTDSNTKLLSLLRSKLRPKPLCLSTRAHLEGCPAQESAQWQKAESSFPCGEACCPTVKSRERGEDHLLPAVPPVSFHSWVGETNIWHLVWLLTSSSVSRKLQNERLLSLVLASSNTSSALCSALSYSKSH